MALGRKSVIAIGFLFIALALWLIYQLSIEVSEIYGKADADTKLGVLTATGSAAAFILNNMVQSSRERKARLFESKREAYDRFFSFFFSLFTAQRSGAELETEATVQNFQEFTRSVMTWGSAETVNALNHYQRAAEAAQENPIAIFTHTETLLRALRKDLGHSDSRLENLALTKLILKGDEHHKLS